MIRALVVAGFAVIAWAVVAVPLPFIEVEPGGALSVTERVELDHDDVDEPTGELLLTTVRFDEPTTAELVAAWFDDDTDLLLRERLIPRGVDTDEYVRTQRRVFEESGRVAAAVGLRAAGFDPQVRGEGARVDRVIEGSPADEVLRSGDVITAVEGEPVETAGDLVRAVGAAEGEVVLEVQRGEDELTVEIEPEPVDDLDRPALGILVATAGLDVDLPFDVEVDAGAIGGPSAGLMLALTVYELADDGDLTDGRVVAGTGTVDVQGRVGPVGGVDQKVAAAEAAGADVFLVPAGEADAARDAAGGELEVVAVETVEEAIAALQATA